MLLTSSLASSVFHCRSCWESEQWVISFLWFTLWCQETDKRSVSSASVWVMNGLFLSPYKPSGLDLQPALKWAVSQWDCGWFGDTKCSKQTEWRFSKPLKKNDSTGHAQKDFRTPWFTASCWVRGCNILHVSAALSSAGSWTGGGLPLYSNSGCWCYYWQEGPTY